jgi:uncharacterized protein (DUF1015 family)
MADIAPLRPLRFAPERLADLIAPPYDVIGEHERASLAARDRFNVVRLILPQAPHGADADAKYAQAAADLASFRLDGALTRDEQPAFYRLDQTFVPPGGGAKVTRTGFLGLVRLVDFADRVVLPHERTLSGPKEDRLKLFRATHTNLSPGFMLYRDPGFALTAPLSVGTELARFSSQAASEPSPIEQVVTKIADPQAIAAIVRHVAKGQLLIADGHHRYETALRYSREIEAQGPTSPRAEHKWFMVYFANEDDPGLLVFPTHRLVHGLANFSLDALLAKIGDAFEAQEIPAHEAPALTTVLAESGRSQPSLVAVDRHGRAVLLRRRANFDAAAHPTLGSRTPALRQTDVALLHAVILEHALGISLDAQAKQTNLTYFKDAKESLAQLHKGAGDVLFLMNATPVSQVRAVAAEGEVMPQKATYFYPKVPTGLAIHTLDPSREVAG